MTNLTTGLIVTAVVFVPLAIMWWLATQFEKPKCIYPHCSASRVNCLHACPHWRDEHSDYDGDAL